MAAAKKVDLDGIRDAVKASVSLVEYTTARLNVEWERKGTRHVALCPHPDHDERTPSFTVEDSSPERAYCFGCGKGADVISIARDHLGLFYREALMDLAAFGDIPVDGLDDYVPPPRPAPRIKTAKPKAKKLKAERIRLIRTRRWCIKDATGKHIATHVRQDFLLADETRDREIRWYRANGKAGLNGLPIADLPLYRSEHVKDYPLGLKVYVTEGEPDCDALTEAGYYAVATVTAAGGCPSAASLEVLRGRVVVIWGDADDPGIEHAVKVSKVLKGIAKEVTIITLPAPGKKGAGAADHPAIIAEIERRRTANSERKGA